MRAATLAELSASHSGVVVIVGPIGSGKIEMLRDFASELGRGQLTVRLVRVVCYNVVVYVLIMAESRQL